MSEITFEISLIQDPTPELHFVTDSELDFITPLLNVQSLNLELEAITQELKQELLSQVRIKMDIPNADQVLKQRAAITDQMIAVLKALDVDKIKQKTGDFEHIQREELENLIQDQSCEFRKQILKMFALACGQYICTDELNQNERALYWQSDPELFRVEPKPELS